MLHTIDPVPVDACRIVPFALPFVPFGFGFPFAFLFALFL